MKLVLFLGALVVFISCFFIFFTFDSMIRTKIMCSYEDRFNCNLSEFNTTVIFGIIIVGMFLFVDVMVVYIMVRAWVPGLLIYG